MLQSLRPIDVLLVEDNPADVFLTRRALDELDARLQLHVATDGDSALNFLRREAPYQHVPRPDLILLDLNLPGIDGYEVLRFIKADASLREIPVVILSSSGASRDIRAAYRLSANCYVRKPVGLDDFSAAIHSIHEFWVNRASLPQSH